MKEWFKPGNSEEAFIFLDRAEAYLRRYGLPEKLKLKVMEEAVPTGSFVAFFLSDRFTQMLLFAVVEYCRATTTELVSAADAERHSAGGGTLVGFCF